MTAALSSSLLAQVFAVAPHPAPEAAIAELAARGQGEALIERFVGIVAERVLSARGEAALVARIDELLESGLVASHLRPLYAALRRDGVLSSTAAVPRLLAGATLDGAARALLDAAEADLQYAQRAEAALATTPGALARFDEALLEDARRPLWFLSELPVPIAELLLRVQRLAPALVALSVAAQHPALVAAEPAAQRALAGMIAEGARAGLRLLATLQPELVDAALVPPAERLDLSALEAQRRREASELAALAEKAEATQAPVRVEARAHGA